ncbi:hypothetical protein L207DRAFT_464242 [Hyaloscypha variabilis F]|uniref:Transcription factor IIIC subunit 5 HTH domain-containing protein n=1 Tax=Hyaloscypha variabilis (strain UAMH 11265 / GT02V1 / F) TaxID=1149755 RepID=A0A2J6RGW2_HYAVF|nr:hypothetical protein L207DRAFT_464242 [Hyaloscypha variabilis F]
MDKGGRPPRKKQRRPLPSARPPPEPESEPEAESDGELAPEFKIGTREIVAVEHPMIIQNLDNGIKTFGNNQPFERIINCIDPDECIPLYLRYRDPTSAPILSQSTSTQNIVLKITVPKRTGRRRKKGSQDPFTSYGGPELPVAKENAVGQNSQGVQTTDGSGLPNTTRSISGQGFQISTAPELATAREDATGQIVPDVHMDDVRIPSDWGNNGPPIPADLGVRRPWEYVAPQVEDAQSEHDEPPEPPEPELCSHSRMDTSLRRKLIDNVGKYTCEAVAEVKQTHRFRGLADFHQSTTHLPFFSKFRDLALSGNIEKMREFKFDPSRGWKPNEEIIMPPNITIYPFPFNWSFQQNPLIVQETDPVTGQPILVNTSRFRRTMVEYLPHNMETIPDGPATKPPDEKDLHEIIENIKKLYKERPIWTRRAIINKVNYALTEATLHLIKMALPFVGYRFRDGPFKDAIIKFGIDPRKDPQYRMYQTIYFQLAERDVKDPSAPWLGVRKSTKTPKQSKRSNDKLSHFFNGRDVAVDGKIWQMCDVTDPLLARLIRDAPISEVFDAKNDGWFCNGTLAKIRAIMKVKIIALHTGRVVTDEDFKAALDMPDIIPDREARQVWIPVPDVRLSKEEMEVLRASGKDFTIMSGMIKEKRTYRGRVGKNRKPVDEGSDNAKPGDVQQAKLNRMRIAIQKSMSRDASRPAPDPQPLADQPTRASIEGNEDVNMEEDGNVNMEYMENEEYDDEEDGMGDSDLDRSSDLEEDDDDDDMDAFGQSPVNSGGGRGESEVDSVDLVAYQELPIS